MIFKMWFSKRLLLNTKICKPQTFNFCHVKKSNHKNISIRYHQIFLLLQRETESSVKYGSRNKCTITRSFHTSKRRCIDPVVWPFIRKLLKGTGVISGRSFRKWWQALPDKKRQYFVHSASRRKKEVMVFIGLLCLCFYIYHHTHLQIAPVTKRTRFIAFTDYQFKKISAFQAKQYISEMKDKFIPEGHIYYNIVMATLSHIINSNKDIEQLKDIYWTVAIVDDPAVNANVLPTGHVFVNRGLIEFVTDEDQLAVILGHEMAHALLKHGAENLSRTQLVDYFVILTMTALWALMPTDGIAIVTHWFFNKVVKLMLHLPYSRFLETEADKVGLELTAKACYDIRSATVLWTLMDLSGKVKGTTIPEWNSTHPSPKNRAELTDQCLLHKYLHIRHECNCPPLPHTDPRDKLHDVKNSVENLLTARKARANIKRFKIAPPDKDNKPIVMSAIDHSKAKESDIKIEILPSLLKSDNINMTMKNQAEKIDEMNVIKVEKTDQEIKSSKL